VCCSVLQCVAVCCSVLQCVAVCCSVLQCVAVCCSGAGLQARMHAAISNMTVGSWVNTLQHTETHCNTPHLTAPDCYTLHHATPCNTVQCNTVQHSHSGNEFAHTSNVSVTATPYRQINLRYMTVLQCVAACCSVLQCVAVPCSYTLQSN